MSIVCFLFYCVLFYTNYCIFYYLYVEYRFRNQELTSENSVLPSDVAASTRSPTVISDINLISPDSIVTLSLPAKQDNSGGVKSTVGDDVGDRSTKDADEDAVASVYPKSTIDDVSEPELICVDKF